MNEIRATVDSDPSRAIAALSHELHLPKERVLEIYRMEFDRLATRARIPTFMSHLTASEFHFRSDRHH